MERDGVNKRETDGAEEDERIKTSCVSVATLPWDINIMHYKHMGIKNKNEKELRGRFIVDINC